MKKAKLIMAMIGGSIITYMMMNKDMRKMTKKKIDYMFNTVEDVMGD